MEEKEVKAVKPAKAASKNYIVVAGFDTSDGKRFEVGDKVDGLKPADLEALIEMKAVAEEGK